MPLKNQMGRLFRVLMFIVLSNAVLSNAAIGTAFAGYQPLAPVAPEPYLDWNAKERVFFVRKTSKERGSVLIIADNDGLDGAAQKDTGKTSTAAPDKDAAHDWSLSANTDDGDWVRPKNSPHDYLVHRNNKKGGGKEGRLDRDDLDRH